MTSFQLTGEHNQSYRQQYANIYFMRLAKLKSVVLGNAKRKWSDVAGTSSFSNYSLPYWTLRGCLTALLNSIGTTREPTGDPVYVPRVLDVQKGKLCYIVGTVYMDMPLKPNVLVDLGKEVRFSGFVRHKLVSCMQFYLYY